MCNENQVLLIFQDDSEHVLNNTKDYCLSLVTLYDIIRQILDFFHTESKSFLNYQYQAFLL